MLGKRGGNKKGSMKMVLEVVMGRGGNGDEVGDGGGEGGFDEGGDGGGEGGFDEGGDGGGIGVGKVQEDGLAYPHQVHEALHDDPVATGGLGKHA